MKDETKGRLRFVMRYVIAAVMIPVGLLMGLGGIVQYLSRRVSGGP